LGAAVTDGVSEGAGVGVCVKVSVGARVAVYVKDGVSLGVVIGEATTITTRAGWAVAVGTGSVCKVQALAQALNKIATRTYFNIRKKHQEPIRKT